MIFNAIMVMILVCFFGAYIIANVVCPIFENLMRQLRPTAGEYVKTLKNRALYMPEFDSHILPEVETDSDPYYDLAMAEIEMDLLK